MRDLAGKCMIDGVFSLNLCLWALVSYIYVAINISFFFLSDILFHLKNLWLLVFGVFFFVKLVINIERNGYF